MAPAFDDCDYCAAGMRERQPKPRTVFPLASDVDERYYTN